MAQSQSIRTDLPSLSFSSVLTRRRNRSTTRPYQQFSRVVSNSARLPSKKGRENEEDKVHQHLLVVAPERPAVDKLLAQEFGRKSLCPISRRLKT